MPSFSLTIVISIYNEEKNIPLIYPEIESYLSEYNYNIVFVNDGSYDDSLTELQKLKSKNDNIKIINFSRNFGHEAAMIAGIDQSQDDYIICMDGDMQHPPSILPEILKQIENGYSIVTLKREDRKDHNYIKKLLSAFFYWFLNLISPLKLEPNASDFFMIDEKVATVLKKDYRERNRFLRGFVQSVGFRKTTVTYNAPGRIHGESSYNFSGLLKLSIQAIVAFSKRPLYIGIYLGVLFSVFSIILAIYSIIIKIFGDTPPGYTTLVVIISALFAIQFFIIGIIGIYIGFMFEEQKNRPIYIIDDL